MSASLARALSRRTYDPAVLKYKPRVTPGKIIRETLF